jgi:hypothetical protein
VLVTTGIRAVGPGLADVTAQVEAIGEVTGYTSAAAASVDAHLSATIAAGTDSNGKAWPKKQDGSLALRNAKAAVEVRAAGPNVIVELSGVEVFHHYGAGDNPERAIIPKELDEKLGQAIRRGAVEAFEAKTAAGKRGYAATRAKGINPRTGQRT